MGWIDRHEADYRSIVVRIALHLHYTFCVGLRDQTTTQTDEKKEVTREHHQEIISNWVYHLSYFSRNFK